MNRLAQRGAIVAPVLLSASSLARLAPAQHEPVTLEDATPFELVTDRPDFTESAETVPPGRVQLEAGFTFSFDEEGDQELRAWELPQALVRIGIAERFELRLGLPSFAIEDADDAGSTSGMTDAELGFKVKLAQQEGWVPHLAVIGAVSLPFGTGAFTSDAVEPSGVLAWAYDLPADFSIGGNAGLASATDGADRFLESSASVALGIPLGDRLAAFVEYFGFYRAGGGPGPEHYADGGFTFLLTPRLQLDAFVGFGLNDNATDLFTGAGVSILF